MRDDTGREQIEPVAAFQHTDDRTASHPLAQRLGPLHDVVGLEGEFAERIAGERVESRRDEQDVGTPLRERRIHAGEKSRTYTARGSPPGRGTLNTFPTPRSSAAPVPGYHGN